MPRRTALDAQPGVRPHATLSRERLLAAAIELADRDGIEAVSMRKLAQGLGFDPMSLYNHVRNKDDLLDSMIDAVVGDIRPDTSDRDWKISLSTTVLSARRTLLRHPWVPGVIDSRRDPGPATLRYLDTVLGILRRGGFSVDEGHHALHILGSRILGFTRDLFDDRGARPTPEAAAAVARQLAADYPHLAELAVAATHDGGLGGCDDDAEFVLALDLILDGLERRQRGDDIHRSDA
jgi:AcrR family transcriptional regulator